MFRFFTPLFAEIDHVTMTFARDVSSRIIVAVTPVASVGLMLCFSLWGMLVMRGVVQQPVREFLGKVIRTALIVSVALGTGMYQSTVADVVRAVPDELAGVVMGGGDGLRLYGSDNRAIVVGIDGSEQGEAALMDRAAGLGLQKVGEAFEKGSILTQQGMAFYTFGVLLLIATMFMVCFGGALIVAAKVVLGLLVALGPLFIAALLFEATKRFWERWVAMVATYALLVVLVACVFTFMLGMYGHYMTGVNLDGNMNVAYGIGGALGLTIISMLLLREVHRLAMGLGGGFAERLQMTGRLR